MKKIKPVATVASIGIAAYLGSIAGRDIESNKSMVEKIKSQGTRYVLFSKTEFKREPGKSYAMVAPGGEPLKFINGSVFKKKPDIVLGNDWELVEEQVFHTQQVSGCANEPQPCKDPTPTPRPTGSPCVGGNCGTPPPEESPTPPPSSGNEFQWWGKQVGADLAAQTVDTSSITICVLDTGSDLNHPELNGVLAGGTSMIGGSYQDDQGHGTHVAGIIAAKNGNGGISGVSRAKIYTVKVLDRQGSGMSSWIAQGIVHCADLGLDISMSLGSDFPDRLIEQAVNYALTKGITIVAAAGNSGGPVGYPAAYPGVIAVSAVDKNNRLASFSSRGAEVGFAGYGVDILSLRLGGGTTTMSGTSMATPGVAGVLAFAKKTSRPIKAINLGLIPTQQGKGLAHANETIK